MNLTRNNYEEYFLLYTDHELSDMDRKLVEDFVQDNPDLNPELDLFIASKFSVDGEVVFKNMESLFRKSSSIINESNYELYQLHFIDNELPGNLRKEILHFNTLNPEAQLHLDLLFKTKLEADLQIVHPDKKSLLSQNIDRRRVIPLFPYWLRISAAAAILLAISLLTFNPFKTNQSTTGFVSKTGPEKSMSTQHKNELAEIKKSDPEKHLMTNHSTELVKTVITARPVLPAKTETANPFKNTALINDKNQIVTIEDLNPVRQLNQTANQEFNKVVVISANNPSQQIINNTVVTTSQEETYHTQSTAINEFLINASTDDNSNKSLRGIFRKATRYFERTTNINTTDGEDRLLIAGLAINLK